MARTFIIFLFAAISAATMLVGCGDPTPAVAPMHIEFLTREGCAGSAAMRANLDAALATSARRVVVDVVDVATLCSDDYRTGYGTPTILVGGEDLLRVPRPAPSAPT